MTFLGFMKQIGLWDFEGLQQDWIKIQSCLPGFQKHFSIEKMGKE